MALPVTEVAEILRDRLRISGSNVLTMPWKEFYRINRLERFRDERAAELRRVCLEEYGMIFGYGQRVVSVHYDTNFASN